MSVKKGAQLWRTQHTPANTDTDPDESGLPSHAERGRLLYAASHGDKKAAARLKAADRITAALTANGTGAV